MPAVAVLSRGSAECSGGAVRALLLATAELPVAETNRICAAHRYLPRVSTSRRRRRSSAAQIAASSRQLRGAGAQANAGRRRAEWRRGRGGAAQTVGALWGRNEVAIHL